MLEKTLESTLDSKELKPVSPKGNQPWIFIGRTDAEAEAPILWPADMKIQLTGKDPGAGKDWGQEEKGTTEDEMFGWHPRLDGHKFEQAPGIGDGQGRLCCSPWSLKELDMIYWLNNVSARQILFFLLLHHKASGIFVPKSDWTYGPSSGVLTTWPSGKSVDTINYQVFTFSLAAYLQSWLGPWFLPLFPWYWCWRVMLIFMASFQ